MSLNASIVDKSRLTTMEIVTCVYKGEECLFHPK